MKTCDVCLGTGIRLSKECPECLGFGFVGGTYKTTLVEFITKEVEKAGFKIYLQDSERTSINGIECSAFFDPKIKTLAVAKKHPNFFENLLHEFCHLRQFQVNCKEWEEGMINGADSSDVLDGFLNGSILLNDSELKLVIDRIIELEWDCECRVMDYLSTVDDYPDVDIFTYNKNAFLYMRFYRAVEYFKKWHLPGKDFLTMDIHNEYFRNQSNEPKYNDPISDFEINIFRKCFE